MSNTPELPEDIKKEIALESEDYANKRYKYRLYPNEWMAAYNAHHAGATAMYEKLKAASQPIGAVWVKASERLPTKEHNYHVKATTKFQGYNHNDTALWRCGKWEFEKENGRIVVEWLDETPSPTAAGDGKEAIEMLHWMTENGIVINYDGEIWQTPNNKLLTEAELYNIFKQQKQNNGQ